MRQGFCVASVVTLLAVAVLDRSVAAQSNASPIDLVVAAGRPLRVTLDEAIRLTRAGQPVTGTVVESVYAYDRVVIPVGTKVRGHVARITSGSPFVRARAYFGGNFSPVKHAVLQFDTLWLDDGSEVPIETVVVGGISNTRRNIAGGSQPGRRERSASADEPTSASVRSRVSREIRQRTTDAVAEAKQRVHDAIAYVRSLKQPGQLHRLKDAAVQQLPYHPQYLAKGTVYDAPLSSSISFGRVVPAAAAPPGTAPAPDTILTARLATTLDSSRTPRGTPFEAVITETVFSADHQVVLPEGSKLTGEVTFAAPARRFHRNGRLRFLVEQVQLPNQPAVRLLAALHSVDASADDHVSLDDEGGVTLENSKARFVAPALSILSLHASLEGDGHSYADPDGDGSTKTAGSGAGSRGLGGFIGMGVVGAALSQVTRPVGIALGVYGAVRTTYTNVLGKGHEVTFAAGTPIQMRLASGPTVR